MLLPRHWARPIPRECVQNTTWGHARCRTSEVHADIWMLTPPRIMWKYGSPVLRTLCGLYTKSHSRLNAGTGDNSAFSASSVFAEYAASEEKSLRHLTQQVLHVLKTVRFQVRFSGTAEFTVAFYLTSSFASDLGSFFNANAGSRSAALGRFGQLPWESTLDEMRGTSRWHVRVESRGMLDIAMHSRPPR